MVNRESFSIESDGILISMALFIPECTDLLPGLILCHGMPAGSQISQVPASDDDPGYPDIAEECARAGFATLIFNFRGTGKSGGDYQPLGWARDLEAMLTFMHGVPQVDTSRIILLGSSMGAAVAIYVAAHHLDVAGLVTYASPASMTPRANPTEALEQLRHLGVIRNPEFPSSVEAWNQESLELSPIRWIEFIAPRPLLLLHGELDNLIPPDNAHLLFEQAGNPKEILILPNAGHRFRHETAALEQALRWMQKWFVY